MKLFDNIILYMPVLLLMSACSKDTLDSAPISPTEPQEIVLKLASNLTQYPADGTAELPRQTSVGVSAVPYNQPPSTGDPQRRNIQFTSGTSGILSSADPLKLREKEDYSICAYAPYKVEATDHPESIPFVHGEDVLSCPMRPSIICASGSNCSASLNLVHLMAQVRFIVSVREEPETGGLNASSVLRAAGFFPDGQLNLETCTLVPSGEPSEQTEVKASAGIGKSGKYELVSSPVCFFTTPGSEQDIELRVTHEGILRTGKITRIFLPGESYTFTLQVDGQRRELNLSASVTDWINEYESIEIN